MAKNSNKSNDGANRVRYGELLGRLRNHIVAIAIDPHQNERLTVGLLIEATDALAASIPANGPVDSWQQGVASMAENARADVAWSRECLKRGDDPNLILDRMDEWLKKIIEGINPPGAGVSHAEL